MNIKDLRYLVALAEHNHFGNAASACFVSQPALSMQIKKLEETLGVQLLERTNKSVRLTEPGKVIAERAHAILNQVDEVRDIARNAKDPFSGEFKLGIIPTLAPYLLPHIMPQLVKHYPKLRFYLMEEQTALLVEKLKQGKIHAAILALPTTEKSFASHALFEEEFMLAVPPRHELAKLKQIKPDHLQNINLLLLEDGHCLRDQALTFCHRMKVQESQDFRATSLETLRHMVAAGVGVTLMPKLACANNDSVVYIPFAKQKPSRTVGLVWRDSTAKKILMDDLIAKIKWY